MHDLIRRAHAGIRNAGRKASALVDLDGLIPALVLAFGVSQVTRIDGSFPLTLGLVFVGDYFVSDLRPVKVA